MTSWEVLHDLHDTIITMAGPLTQYLNGVLRQPDWGTTQNIWGDVFQNDWEGDWNRLPTLYPMPRTYRRIRSKRTYERCKEYFGRHDPSQQQSYSFYPNEYYVNYQGIHATRRDIGVTYIHAAPMENVWLDELQDLLKFPIALAHAAVAGGHIRLLKYLIANHEVDVSQLSFFVSPELGYAMDIAAHYGDLDMIKFLHDSGSQACSTGAMDFAAREGHFEVVKWLHENRTEGCTAAAINSAINHGHMHIAAYIETFWSAGISEKAMDEAAMYGRLDVVKLLHEQRHARCTTAAMDRAAAHGHLDVVEYLHENRTEGCTTDAMDGAVCNGYLEIVEFLHFNRTEGCTDFAIDSAARNGHFEILKFLHEHRTEGGTTKAIDRAAHRDQMAIVQFLHQHRHEGCTTRAIDWAASAGHLSMIQFLLMNRTEGFTFRAIYWAANRDDDSVLRYLLEHDPTRRKAKQAVERAIRDKQRNAFAKLQALGCPGTEGRDIERMNWNQEDDFGGDDESSGDESDDENDDKNDDDSDDAFGEDKECEEVANPNDEDEAMESTEEDENDGNNSDESYWDWDSDYSAEGCKFWKFC